jgi:hypothetical protein
MVVIGFGTRSSLEINVFVSSHSIVYILPSQPWHGGILSLVASTLVESVRFTEHSRIRLSELGILLTSLQWIDDLLLFCARLCRLVSVVFWTDTRSRVACHCCRDETWESGVATQLRNGLDGIVSVRYNRDRRLIRSASDCCEEQMKFDRMTADKMSLI